MKFLAVATFLSLTVIACSFGATAAVVAHVGSDAQFLAALTNNSVTRIIVDKDIRFEQDEWITHCTPEPCHLARNVTVTSDPAGPHKVLDFNARDIQRLLIIDPGVNFSMIHLTMKDSRYGAGADIDLLAPSPDGILYLHDLAKLHTSCAPLVHSQILGYQRDNTVPGENIILFPKHTTWDGKLYNDTIQYIDFCIRLSVGENVPDGGYVVHKRGTYKLCDTIIDPECQKNLGATACVKVAMDLDHETRYPQPPPGVTSTQGFKVGVGVAAAAGGVALLALLGLLLLRRSRRGAGSSSKCVSPELPLYKGTHPQQKQHQSGATPSSSSSSRYLFWFGGSLGGKLGREVSTFSSRLVVVPAPPDSRGSSSGAEEVGLSSGWDEVGPSEVNINALPNILSSSLSKEEAATVQLGLLVGTGSFGRVFRGKYKGRAVAVKVINHSKTSAERVSMEVELMRRFKHPHVVEAYEFVTWGSVGASRISTGGSDMFLKSGSSSTIVPVRGTGSSNGNSAKSSSDGHTSDTDKWAKSHAHRNAHSVETWILQEYCNAGTLQNAVMAGNARGFFMSDVPQMHVILEQLQGVAHGMEYLHSCNVCHGDLKADNILLCWSATPASTAAAAAAGAAAGPFESSASMRREGELAADTGTGSSACGSNQAKSRKSSSSSGANALTLVPKVADFGLSRIMHEGQTHLSTHTLGTITHQPPELMRTGRLTKASDVFSFGVLMWEVFMAEQPWKGKMMGEIMTHVMLDGGRLRFRSNTPKAYVQLAQACWMEDPQARPAFSQVVKELEQLRGHVSQMQVELEANWSNVSGFWAD